MLDRLSWLEGVAAFVLGGIACVIAVVVALALAVWLAAPGKRRRETRPVRPADER